MQLVTLPDGRLYLYYKKGRVGDETRTEERVEEKSDVGFAVKEFAQLFEEATGNEFQLWEKEKRFAKKSLRFYPIDMVMIDPLPLLPFHALFNNRMTDSSVHEG